jgi:glycosyltransferase involved in cell wall biosynthesis
MWWSWNLPTADIAGSEALSSIVITVKNEEAHLEQLLESLLSQEPPLEIILVDAFSTDRTFEIAQDFAKKHPDILRVYQVRGRRGFGRNFGVQKARGSRVYFIDGDCVADSHWLAALKAGFSEGGVVAGKTLTIGVPKYASLERVELFHRGMDVTYPSCNLAYNRDLFEKLSGFDGRFETAEDIDLNLRAVTQGAKIVYRPEAVVYHNSRTNIFRFLLQAFWNGYGRKQLTEKHGHLWAHYRYRRMLETQRSVLAYARLAAALTGYFTRLITTVGSPGRIAREEPAPSVTRKATKG